MCLSILICCVKLFTHTTRRIFAALSSGSLQHGSMSQSIREEGKAYSELVSSITCAHSLRSLTGMSPSSLSGLHGRFFFPSPFVSLGAYLNVLVTDPHSEDGKGERCPK